MWAGMHATLYFSFLYIIQLRTEKGVFKEVPGLEWWLFEGSPVAVL